MYGYEVDETYLVRMSQRLRFSNIEICFCMETPDKCAPTGERATADAIVVGKKTSRYIPVARTPSKFHHSKKKFKSLEILTMERS